MNDDFYNMVRHYYENDHPPLMVSKTSGATVRHGGSSGRCAFWAGYDGLNGGIYPPTRNGSAIDSAYRAGIKYRKAVETGARPALPAAYEKAEARK